MKQGEDNILQNLCPVRSVKSSDFSLLTNVFDLLVLSRQGQLGSREVAEKGIQKALPSKTTSLGEHHPVAHRTSLHKTENGFKRKNGHPNKRRRCECV